MTAATPSPTEVRLRAELREANEVIAAQADRLAELQTANEGWYRASYDATGGPRFDGMRPFGHLTPSSFTDPAQRAAARMLNRTAEENL